MTARKRNSFGYFSDFKISRKRWPKDKVTFLAVVMSEFRDRHTALPPLPGSRSSSRFCLEGERGQGEKREGGRERDGQTDREGRKLAKRQRDRDRESQRETEINTERQRDRQRTIERDIVVDSGREKSESVREGGRGKERGKRDGER